MYRDDFATTYDNATTSFWRILWLGILAILFISALGVAGCAIGLFTGAAHDGAAVIKKELYPTALLAKYEWFKDAAAALDAKAATIKVYEGRFAALNEAYAGVKRRDWPRDDREHFALMQSELAGVKASYNLLAAEYNSQMAKMNWAFTNVGQVPQGGAPLPREYRVYLEQ